MSRSIFIAFLSCFTVPAFAWQQKSTPIDTIPGKKVLPHGNGNKNLLAFPFAVRSLETNWGFGGIAARFFKPGHDTTVRTSDVNILGLYTLRSQLILVLSSTVFFPHEDHIARFQASYSYYPDDFWGSATIRPTPRKKASAKNNSSSTPNS